MNSKAFQVVFSTQGGCSICDPISLPCRRMYFNCSIRRHPETRVLAGYYRLVKSYRNANERVCHRARWNVGFIEGTTADQCEGMASAIQYNYFLEADELIVLFYNSSETVLKVNGKQVNLKQRSS